MPVHVEVQPCHKPSTTEVGNHISREGVMLLMRSHSFVQFGPVAEVKFFSRVATQSVLISIINTVRYKEDGKQNTTTSEIHQEK